MDPQGTVFMNQVTGFPGDITILHGVVRLKFEDGTIAEAKTGVYNHHVVFADTNKRPLALVACPGQAAKPVIPISVMLGTGEDNSVYEYTPDSTDFSGGYYVGKDHGLWFTSELVNYSSENKTVYAVVDFDYVEGKEKVDVSPETLGVSQCDGSIGLRAPKGEKKFEFKSKSMKFQHDGALFGIRGHLHDGGTALVVRVNNQTVCKSEAQYKEGGKEAGTWDALSGMSSCNDLIPVKKGDELSLVAQYDLGLHPARSHAGGGEAEEMGLALFSFAANGTAAPEKSSSPFTSGSFTTDMSGLWGTITTPVVTALSAGFAGAAAPFMAIMPMLKKMFGTT